ncbi:MAG: hypothetical protein AAF228_04970 [Pseudomonadota bacterium]
MPDKPEVAEHERYARTLASLVRLFDKLAEMETDDQQRSVAEDAKHEHTLVHSKDAERLRADLASRLEQLQVKTD